MIKKIFYYSLLLCFLSSCDNNVNSYQIDNDINDTINRFDLNISSLKGINRCREISDFGHDSMIVSRHSPSLAYKNADTLYLLLKQVFGYTLFKVYKKKYSINYYIDDRTADVIINNENGMTEMPELESHSLVFKRENFNIGDTILGFYKMSTKEFEYDFKSLTTKVDGCFYLVIQEKDVEKIKMNFPYPH